jgi:hypothetical protein
MHSEKLMLTIVWNPTGFHSSLRYVTDICVPLLEWRKTQVDGSDRKLTIDADNACPQMARETLEYLKHTWDEKSTSSTVLT